MTRKKPASKEQKRRNERLERKRTILRDFDLPSIRIEANLASPTFTSVVRSIVEKIDLFDRSLFSPEVQNYFRDLKRYGVQVALERAIPELKAAIESQSRANHSPMKTVTINPSLLLGIRLGDAIVDKIDEDLLPMNDVEVHFVGNEIVLALSSLLQRNAGGKKVFHSRNRFQIEADTKKYVLAFDEHTIKAICNRFRPDFLTYGGLGEAHAIFSYLNYAEVVRLPKGNFAVSIFNICLGPGTWQYDNYVGRCLPGVEARGIETRHQTWKPFGYRIGYCPIDLVDDYAITRTFLPPGFAATPERQLLKSKCSDSKERYRLTRIAQKMDFHMLLRGKGFDAIEWFHGNGVPQVIDPSVPLFDQDYFKRKIGQA